MISGTIINYYFHCKRQCYLFGNRMNLEDNSELVRIGRALHEERDTSESTEITIDNIRVDRLTSEYLTEVKKSDADVDAAKWQLLFYLKILKDKGINRKGRLEFIEKNKSSRVMYFELTNEIESELENHIKDIEQMLLSDDIPEGKVVSGCKKCAYYEYCCI